MRSQAVQRGVEQRAKRAAQSIQFLKKGIHRIVSFLYSSSTVYLDAIMVLAGARCAGRVPLAADHLLSVTYFISVAYSPTGVRESARSFHPSRFCPTIFEPRTFPSAPSRQNVGVLVI